MSPGSSLAATAKSLFKDTWKSVDSTPYGACDTNGANFSCAADPGACTAEALPTIRGVASDVMQLTPGAGGVAAGAGGDGQTQVGKRTVTGQNGGTSLGARCAGPAAPAAAAPAGPARTPAGQAAQAEEPVVITVTREDFAKLPVEASSAHAGPDEGWLPANMDLVLYAEGEEQELETELLDTPVTIRAVPESYRWDLGDGNVLVTDDPGSPYPAKDVSATYDYEGWYDVTLTTTYAGQFSVDGGEWQDIDGTIDVPSDPTEVYSKSLESRLVNPVVAPDDAEDPFIPERSSSTEGPKDPDATETTL